MPIETPRNASPRSVRLLVAWLLLAIALAGAGWIGAERRPARETRIELRHRVDLERADAGEIAALPGIGAVLAERIVADRERRGPFRHLEELMRVHGVGPRTVERIRAHAGCGSEEP